MLKYSGVILILASTFFLGIKLSQNFPSYHDNSIEQYHFSSNDPEGFIDMTASAGISEAHSSALVAADYNSDGWVDILAGGKLYRNISEKQNIKFENVTEEVGLNQLQGLALFVDINNDGHLDLVTNKGQIFIQNSVGGFVESSVRLGFKVPGNVHTISIADINEDGWLDFIVGMSEITITQYEPPRLYINRRGLRIDDMTPSSFKNNPNYLRNVALADFDNDGKIEVYFSNYRIRPNNLYKLSPFMSEDLAAQYGVAGDFIPDKYYNEVLKKSYGTRYGHTISSAWADFDNDGNLDLWVSNLAHKYIGLKKDGTYDTRGYLCDDSKIYRNMGSPTYKFLDMRPQSGIPYRPISDYPKYTGDELWAQTTVADFDNDGLSDVYVSQVYDLAYAPSLLFKNLGKFKFQNVAQKHGTQVFDSYAAIWADVNNDGKMDLLQSGRVKNGEKHRFRLLQNVMQNKNNYLKVRLRGRKSSTQAIGAQVRLYHTNGVFLRQQEGNSGTFNQQNDPVLHFGLGDVREISRLEVRWPSRKIKVIKNIKVNQTIDIDEND